MRELRIGILGTGGIAGEHIQSLLKQPAVKIVALCDRDLPKAQKVNAAQLNGAARCYADFATMLAEAPLDAMHACIPPGAHCGEVEQAAAKGIHLFLEKPIALNMERAQSIASAIRKAGVKCQIGHHMRHFDPPRRLKAMIQDGSAGKPLLMQGHWFSRFLNGAWWRYPMMGGGQLIEQFIHVYDLARYFLGDAQTAMGFVGNIGHSRFPEYRVDDNSVASIRFRNGAMASLCSSNCADPWFGDVSFTVVCENVLATFKSPEEAMFLHHDGLVCEEAWRPGVDRKCVQVRHLSNQRDEINRNFIAGIRDNEPLRSSIDDGVEGLRLVLAVTKSSAEGGTPQQL